MREESDKNMNAFDVFVILYILVILGLPILLYITDTQKSKHNLRQRNTQGLGLLLLS